MQKKLTVTIDEKVYEDLYNRNTEASSSEKTKRKPTIPLSPKDKGRFYFWRD